MARFMPKTYFHGMWLMLAMGFRFMSGFILSI
jgi:hypothetical protein